MSWMKRLRERRTEIDKWKSLVEGFEKRLTNMTAERDRLAQSDWQRQNRVEILEREVEESQNRVRGLEAQIKGLRQEREVWVKSIEGIAVEVARAVREATKS